MVILDGGEQRIRVKARRTEHSVERFDRDDQSVLDLLQDSISLLSPQPQLELQLVGQANGLIGLGGGLVTLGHRLGQGEGQ